MQKISNPLSVKNPFDLSEIQVVFLADADEAERVLQLAEQTFRDRTCWLSVPQRVEILTRAAQRMEERRVDLALVVSKEGGKPLTDSLIETDRAIDGVRNGIEVMRTQAGRGIPMGTNAACLNRTASTYLEPIGPVLAFSAFNHPLNLIVHQVVPAIAAGCPVVIKPAEATPLSCFAFVEILYEAGLPKSWCQTLLLESFELAGQMVADPRVAFFSFIGSSTVGWRLRSKLAPGTRCALEHGGIAPVIIAADADLDANLPRLCKGGFYHAGQVCVSVQRVFVHESLARDVTNRLAALAKDLVVGDPTASETEVGPLIRPSEVQRVSEWVEEAVAQGAELVCGGHALSETTFAPTVLFDPSPHSKVSTQEVFGPVIGIYPFQDLDEAIARANATRFAFQASVVTRDIDTAFRVARRLDAATVMVNDHTAFRVDWMPFAGLKESGLGVGGIPYAAREMQIEKQVIFRSTEL